MFDPPERLLADLGSVLDLLEKQRGAIASQAELIEEITLLERIKGAAAARQARVTVTLSVQRAAAEAAAGVPAEKRGQGLAHELALARRTSPHRAARDLGFAKALVDELPHTHSLLSRGEISEWRAVLVARETAVLSLEHRRQVDAELADRLPRLGDGEAAAKARAIGYRLDPGSALRRTRGARSNRNVTLRPAPDTMTYLTGFLPVEQGVACQASLLEAAAAARAAGDTRSRGQVMADTLVERVTGQESAGDVVVEVDVVITDTALFGDDDTPARVLGHGPVPASLARQVVREAHHAWLRRVYARPLDGTLVAMESRRRCFDGELRRAVVIRDEVCRTPWCDAPIRHVDHVRRATDDGETSADNGQGLCEACNYAKEARGWASTRLRGERHRLAITTPTGHGYTSTAPDPPGTCVPPPEEHGDLVHFHPAPWSLDEELDRIRLTMA